MSFDLGDVLDLEQDFHREGFNQGLNEDARKEFIDGKEYGYQIAFQRYLIIGYYKSIINHWLLIISQQDTMSPKLRSSEKTLLSLLQKINGLSFENTEANGILFDDLIKKLKLKMRLTNIVLSKVDGDKLEDMNKTLEGLGGVLEIDSNDSKNDIDNGIW